MTTRSKGKLKVRLFGNCVVNAIRGSKPPTSKIVYLHYRCLHSELQEKEPVARTLLYSDQAAVENTKQW